MRPLRFADGQVGLGGRVAPSSNLGVSNAEGVDVEEGVDGFGGNGLAVEVVGDFFFRRVIGGGEVEPLAAFGNVPDGGRVVDVVVS